MFEMAKAKSLGGLPSDVIPQTANFGILAEAPKSRESDEGRSPLSQKMLVFLRETPKPQTPNLRQNEHPHYSMYQSRSRRWRRGQEAQAHGPSSPAGATTGPRGPLRQQRPRRVGLRRAGQKIICRMSSAWISYLFGVWIWL